MLFFIVMFWTFIGFCMGRNISVGGMRTGGGGEVCVVVLWNMHNRQDVLPSMGLCINRL